MEKSEIKLKIEKLKNDLVKHKEKYKQLNENFKRHISDLQRQAANQTNKDSKTNIKRQIASKKDSFTKNEKRFEKDGAERIKKEIEILKLKLK